ncbi:MAG TPA: divalent-cation tolerance protein CutA [Candidatus Eisenbacteria bacterium]|jgi:uncharacterized protein involved in tolerance to divalent cations|nr:divalent-cation tolerance protein CutA [Candidatus Eisenbacteria bacterium]
MPAPRARRAASAAIVVLTALPDDKSARRLGEALVRGKAAACVTALPGAVSTYFWKGRLERSRETLLLVKTLRRNYPKVEKMILKNHPYELPEILRIPADATEAYRSWLANG